MSEELHVDIERLKKHGDAEVTGIFTRAIVEGGDPRERSVDIAVLDNKSLVAFLRSKGGANEFAEDCIGMILGYGPLHPTGE